MIRTFELRNIGYYLYEESYPPNKQNYPQSEKDTLCFKRTLKTYEVKYGALP